MLFLLLFACGPDDQGTEYMVKAMGEDYGCGEKSPCQVVNSGGGPYVYSCSEAGNTNAYAWQDEFGRVYGDNHSVARYVLYGDGTGETGPASKDMRSWTAPAADPEMVALDAKITKLGCRGYNPFDYDDPQAASYISDDNLVCRPSTCEAFVANDGTIEVRRKANLPSGF